MEEHCEFSPEYDWSELPPKAQHVRVLCRRDDDLNKYFIYSVYGYQ